MANTSMTTTTNVIFDGIKNCIVEWTGLNVDGSVGETLVKKIDVKDLTPIPYRLAIRYLHYDVNGGSVQLFWDAEDPVLIDQFGSVAEEDFSFIGGIQNNAGPSATGSILLSTSGFDVGSSYSIRLNLVKKYGASPNAYPYVPSVVVAP